MCRPRTITPMADQRRLVANLPMDLVKGEKLTPDQTTDLIWWQFTERFDKAVLVNFIWDGEVKFRRAMWKTYGMHALTDKGISELWFRLRNYLPGVPMGGQRAS